MLAILETLTLVVFCVTLSAWLFIGFVGEYFDKIDAEYEFLELQERWCDKTRP